MMRNLEELKASGLLLDLGVSIPLRPLRFITTRKSRTITIRQPTTGGLIRICRQRLQIGVTQEEMKEYTTEQNLEFIAKHGRAISLIVAGVIVQGWLAYPLFGRLVAWWLRWRVHPLFLSEAMYQFFEHLNINPFLNIIRLAEANNLLKPRLSH